MRFIPLVVILLFFGFYPHTILYQASLSSPITVPTRVLVDDYVISTTTEEIYDIACFCVTFLREIKGVNIRGNAEDIISNVDHPLVGGVVLQKYGGIYHASFISAILPSGNMWVEEANKKSCEITSRVLLLNDKAIYGYFFKNPN